MTAKDTANIGTPKRVPLTDLNLYHKNPRVGDTQAIKDSMLANGVFNPLVVNKGDKTGRPMEVLAGNHRLKALRELAAEHPDDPAWGEVDVYLVDVDEERATKILLSDNRTSDLGAYDNALLLEMLETIDHDLDGTGYDYEILEDLNALVEETDLEPQEETSQATTGYEPAEPAPQQSGEASNLYESKGQDHAAPGYADMPTRMMILHYPLDQFVWVAERLSELHEQHEEWDGANANALLYFLEKETGVKAPEADGE